MSQLTRAAEPMTDVRDLCDVLEPALGDYYGASRSIMKLERRPSEYRSSFPLEELDLVLHDGTRLQLIFKDLGELLRPARDAKPLFLLNAHREIETYQKILSRDRMGTAICYAAVDGPERYWLFLEKLRGVELYQVGELEVWQEAARWLAKLHARQAALAAKAARELPLVRYDAAFYRLWLERAVRSSSCNGSGGWIEHLARRYDSVTSYLCGLPTTFLHGEFYASNVLVEQTEAGLRVSPVDWEMAAVGPGLMDLAALISGKWSEEEKKRLALSYHTANADEGAWRVPLTEFFTALDYCRLQLAIQWLGWAPDWTPPPDHVHDWQSEARHVANRLGL